MQFLDEIDKKEVSTTPRAFKDLREFENDAISLLKAQSSRENKTTTTINSSRKSILKEDDVEKPTKPLKRESSSSKIKETLTFNTEVKSTFHNPNHLIINNPRELNKTEDEAATTFELGRATFEGKDSSK